jgi:hypothetical protein
MSLPDYLERKAAVVKWVLDRWISDCVLAPWPRQSRI